MQIALRLGCIVHASCKNPLLCEYVTFSKPSLAPDGSKLLLGSSTLALWDVAEETRIAKFTGHTVRSARA
jgi:hypothetical protein